MLKLGTVTKMARQGKMERLILCQARVEASTSPARET